ncbi:MAG: hypothetical protein PHN88_01335 [Ignavibacteria bacterium]|nr:hypothetical protein [Ignavibacteria bacterium]
MENNNTIEIKKGFWYYTKVSAPWVLAFLITFASAYYQRITGPTYPVSGKIVFQGKEISYKFDRSNSTNENCPVQINVGDNNYKGVLIWKRHKTRDEVSRIDMRNDNGILSAELPKQPTAGKLDYSIRVIGQNTETEIPEKPVVIRYKGDVPAPILFVHIILIFAAMLLSTRAGIEVFKKEAHLKKFTFWALGLMFIGGMILGPIVQKYAFDAYWTGIPFGFDLTDNKTLIAFITWVVAAIMVFKSKKPAYWVLGAAIVTLIVFLIPHSVMGSELDYSKTN